jgi:hypothetical protein
LIFDFTKDENQLHFSFLDPAQFTMQSKQLEGVEGNADLVFPYPVRYGGTLPDDLNIQGEKKEEGEMAFSIHTGAEEALK